ncbi:hypothetical protein Hanom_Chr08g00711411 [Helianthus anomalus]
MASKTDESSSAQASFDALYCKWGTLSFNNLMQEYDIKPEWNPVLPSKQDTTFPLKHGKIALLSDFFKFCNFRLPITKFYIGVSCLRDIPASSRDKDWMKKFFYIDASVIHEEMHWREMGANEKFKDDGPPADAYVENALFKRLSKRPSECTVIPEGALVMAGMSLLRNSRLYPAFQRLDEGEWSLFDFFDPLRNTAFMSMDRAIGEQEPDVLRIRLKQFLLPAVPADPNAYVSQPHPSGGRSVCIAETKKPSRIKITGRKVITAGATTSPVAVSISAALEGATVTSAPTSLVSPKHAPKRRRMMPPLTAFQAIKGAHALPAGSFSETQVGGGSSMPLSSGEIVSSAAGGQSLPLADLISRASVVAVSSSLPSPLFTSAVVATPSSVTTLLFSSSSPVSLFHSPVGICSASEKEMPTTSVAGESTSGRDVTVSDTGGSSGGFVDDKARLADDLYLPTICWDPYAQDKRYQPKWKIAESSRLVFPPVGAGLRDSRFVFEKNKAEEDLKHVTANLAEERIIWARDIAEKDRVLSYAKAVQEELERKGVSEAQKLQQVCDSLVSEKNQLVQSSTAQHLRLKEAERALDQSNAEVDSLISRLAGLQGDRNWLITNGLVGAFEYLRQSESFVTLLYRLSTAAYKSGHHDGVYEGYFSCQQTGRITPKFQEEGGKLTAEMADALEVVYNDLLPAYADLVDKVAEDDVASLRHMLEVADGSGEE